ncbi:replicative DNA helicase [Pseudochrobactrum asaccharolyticum]|uniref:DNA 5'-3' helicase n=2 Tax=Pseudochrobactrum asaccharolyticum TaxID=354351 RepID=A0A366DKA4_9HYPH|nr:replicative DNA helicase [Pseudochrobactrum asaccharolyticum]
MCGLKEKKMSNDNAQSIMFNNNILEQLILGAILQNEANYWEISDIISMDLFGNDDHKKIYAIIYELANDNRAIRVPIVAGRLGTLSNEQDGETYLSMLLHVASREDSIPLVDFAYELRKSATRRKVKALCESVIKSIGDSNLDPDQIVDRASERLADISRNAQIEHESTISSTINQIFNSATQRAAGMALRPCLKGLEDMIGCFSQGSLVLWGGAPGSGKTAFAMQQLLYSSAIHPASLFELEMDNMSLVARSISGDTGVSMRDILNGLSEDQLSSLLKAKSHFDNRKLTIVSPAKMSIQQVRSRAFAHKKKFGLDIMCVDHLKLLERPSKTRIDPVERAYENARDLKALAKDLGCVVIGLCQFTKAARQKENPEPEMEDFYGGSLEEHADLMLANFNRHAWLEKNPPATKNGKMFEDWMGKKQQTKGEIEVYKLKDRFGSPRDRHIFDWDGRITQFKDKATQEQFFADAELL